MTCYSITSSARARIDGATVRSSALAVFRLTTGSYFVGACTGRSAALSPLRNDDVGGRLRAPVSVACRKDKHEHEDLNGSSIDLRVRLELGQRLTGDLLLYELIANPGR
jgi:hypothetical protein